jgi:hypothetical protein
VSIRALLSASASNYLSTLNKVDFFDDGSGKALYMFEDNALDESGNYNGTPTNVTYGSGRFGKCFAGNGTIKYITSPRIPSIVGNPLSFCFWFKTNTIAPAYQQLFVFSDGIAIEPDISYGNLRLYVYGSPFESGHIEAITANTWYFVSLIFDGSTIKSYINATLKLSHAMTSITQSSKGNHIGIYQDHVNFPLNGNIDQVRIFDKALTQSEVTALYNEI